MMAAAIFFWLRLPSIADRYQSALVTAGLMTVIAAYHYSTPRLQGNSNRTVIMSYSSESLVVYYSFRGKMRGPQTQ